MIKNRTSEFKSKYSSCESKTTSKRQITPEYANRKLAMTGFTMTTQTSTMQKRTTKKLAKVESTAFIKSRARLNDTADEPQMLSKKLVSDETSLCRYLQRKAINIENGSHFRYRKDIEDSDITQKTDNLSEASQVQVVKKKTITIKQLTNVQKFFNSLTPRSLFFCCRCFKYVFAIEKNLHYPECEGEVDLDEIGAKDRENLGWERMNRILELSQYTKNKAGEIVTLLQLIKCNKLDEAYQVDVSPNVSYITFEEIVEAVFYTYQKLLRNNVYNPSGIFSVKKILGCVQARNLESDLFERRFFG